ncbi:MAG: ATP-grasp domain-containing protein, partial [Bacteroidota bacterium]
MSFPTLGILGDGQLGRMSAFAALRMGLAVRTLTPTRSGPIDPLGEVVVGDWTDPDVLRRFATGCTAVTVESEWAPADRLLPVLPDGVALWPHPDTLHLIRDKGLQKQTLADAGLPVAPFARCASLSDAQAAAERFGFPVVVKKYRGSYDGYGNATVQSAEALADAWSHLADDAGALVEAWVTFRQELSVLVARRPGGDHVIYPVAYTEQRDHRCHAVVVPAAVAPATAEEARRIGLAAVEAVGGVGLTAVELFEDEHGHILVNELAPRPHNTGHYSIEGCHTSQFENHVRGVLDLPLGAPDLVTPVAAMINVLGGVAAFNGVMPGVVRPRGQLV